jgi:hypothetical protein
MELGFQHAAPSMQADFPTVIARDAMNGNAYRCLACRLWRASRERHHPSMAVAIL